MKHLEKTYNPNAPKVGVSHVLKYFWRAISPQKWLFYYTLIAFTVPSIIELLIPLLYKKFFDLFQKGISKELLAPQLTKIIIWVLIAHGIIWLFRQTGFFVMNDFVSKTMARIRQLSFDYMIKHSYSFFANNFGGALVQRVSRFARAFDRLNDRLFFNFIPLIIQVGGTIIVVYLQQPIIAYIIIIWAGIMLIYNYAFSTWKLKYDIAAARADSTTTAFLADSLTNQNTISSFTASERESYGFRDTTDSQAKIQKLSWDIGIFKDGIQVGLIFIVEFLLFYYAIKFWQKDLITIGTFVLIQIYILNLAERLWDFGRIIRDTYESFADSKEMVEILETPYEVRDVPTAGKLEVREGNIEFKDVSFAFHETRTVLDKINVEIKGGEKVAFIGPSGAGKSTLVKLILRMYDVSSGEILVDGQNIKEITQDSLRGNISLVPQDPVLFHRTLLENIRYGREGATDEEVIEAARLAHCDEFIESLPLKYETFVGERGIKLSGGERQRVAIARAILKNAPILILDEATSSLDSHSESLIQDALDKLMKGKTSLVIAHRLSTIRKMDRIIVMKEGKIEEDGSHEELLKKEESLYKTLWNLQAGGFLVE